MNNSIRNQVHQALWPLLGNKTVGLRGLAHELRAKADEIEKNAPRDWQIVADAASSIESGDGAHSTRDNLRAIQQEFSGSKPDPDGFEAYALIRLVDALLGVSLTRGKPTKPTCDFSRHSADEIPF